MQRPVRIIRSDPSMLAVIHHALREEETRRVAQTIVESVGHFDPDKLDVFMEKILDISYKEGSVREIVSKISVSKQTRLRAMQIHSPIDIDRVLDLLSDD